MPMDEIQRMMQSMQDEERNTAVISGYECDDCKQQFESWKAFKDHLPC